MSAIGSRPSMDRISRPHAPRPITATLIFAPAAAGSAGGVCAISWTPPSMVIKVAKELLFRKSRRLTPRASIEFSLIDSSCDNRFESNHSAIGRGGNQAQSARAYDYCKKAHFL